MNRQRGFSIIDLMVGLMVGLLVALAVYGTSTVVGAQRRGAISANGAMESGMSGVYTIQHDVKAAGVGILMGGQRLCPSINIYNGGVVANGTAIAPVVIAEAASATTSDTITVAFGDSVLANNGVALTSGMTSAGGALRAQNPRTVAVNDMVIVGDPGTSTPCTLMQITGKTNSGFGWDLAHAANTWNPGNYASTFATAPSYPAGAMMFDIGQLNWLTYRVNNGNLEAVNIVTGAVDVVANDIVQLKAYYGTSNGITPQIEQWVAPNGSWANPLDAVHVAAIRAIRLVVVARSPHPERPSTVGGSCDATTAAPPSWTSGPTLDLSGNANWQCYKYRTLTFVAPLKNVIFGSGGT